MAFGLALGLFALAALCFGLFYKTIDFFENV